MEATVIIDGVTPTPPPTAVQSSSSSYIFTLPSGSTSVTQGQTFTLVKSACYTGCDNLGAQTSVLVFAGANFSVLATPPAAATTSFSYSDFVFLYTSGERYITYSAAGQPSSSTLTISQDLSVNGRSIQLGQGGMFVGGTNVLNPAIRATNTPNLSSTLIPPSSAITTVPLSTNGSSAQATSSSTVGSPTGVDQGPNTSNTSSSSGLSGGAIAGIAIGALIIGVLIGAAIMFCLGRRNSRRARTQSRIGLVEMTTKDREEPHDNSKPAGPSLATIVTSNMTPAAEDRQIEREMGTMCQRIRDHVASYYDVTTPLIITLPDLSTLGPPLQLTPTQLSTLLSAPSTRASALSLLISWTIIHRLSLFRDPSTSFLPLDASTILANVRGAVISGDRAQTASFNLWRTLTATLVASKHKRRSSGPEALQRTASGPPVPAGSISLALAALQPLLTPYASASHADNERRRNLEEIFKRGARFGWLLFAQPGVWEFRWEGEVKEEIYMFPGLVQTVGDEGEVFGQDKSLVEGVVMRA